nr:probable LRR receptor-like serine/threonine-protein kinase At3g47570 [Ipomoea batatas]
MLLLMMSLSMCETTNITTDQIALLALKAHITSDPNKTIATNWSALTFPCSWVGVSCESRHRRVTELHLSGMGLTGEVPPELGHLSFLVSLDLRQNNFHGSLPPNLANMRRLRFLDCSVNNFSGNLPRWLRLLPKLKYLNLKNNSFSGPLPSFLSNITTLERISLSYNSLQGEIPQEIGHLPRLIVLDIQTNHLTGSIPFPIFNISTIQVVTLSGNELSGSLPLDMCDNIPALQGLYLSYNNLEDFEAKYLLKLEKLNRPRGVISWWQPSNCRWDLEKNQLTGFIPSGIFNNMSFLGILYLYGNSLSGTLPQNICHNFSGLRNFVWKPTTSMETFQVSFICAQSSRTGSCLQQFTGTIPYGIFNISTLRVISLTENYRLTGTLPLSLGYNLPNLERLYLAGMNMDGVIPESISNCSKLTAIELSSNNFSGSITRSLGNLSYGIMMMEMFSRRKPTDEMFTEGMSLTSWVRDALPYHPFQVIDASLFSGNNDGKHLNEELQCASSLMKLALHCAGESPEERPTMKEVVATLNKIKLSFLKGC